MRFGQIFLAFSENLNFSLYQEIIDFKNTPSEKIYPHCGPFRATPCTRKTTVQESFFVIKYLDITNITFCVPFQRFNFSTTAIKWNRILERIYEPSRFLIMGISLPLQFILKSVNPIIFPFRLFFKTFHNSQLT